MFQIFEVAPRSVDDLPIGTRVVAYWSEKYSYLFPGTIGERVEDPKTKDQCLVIVELDDGDDRAHKYQSVENIECNNVDLTRSPSSSFPETSPQYL